MCNLEKKWYRWTYLQSRNRDTNIDKKCLDTKEGMGSGMNWEGRDWHVCTVSVLSRFNRFWLFVTPWTVACQAPLSVGFSRQEYWNGLPCPLPGDLPCPGTELHLLSDLHCRWILCAEQPGKPHVYTAAAAKSLQSCLTLCDPIDCSPPGSPVPGILQARTLEWVAISLSKAWKWKVKVKSLSRVWPSATPWTAAYQGPPSMGFSRQEYWSGVPLPSPT